MGRREGRDGGNASRVGGNTRIGRDNAGREGWRVPAGIKGAGTEGRYKGVRGEGGMEARWDLWGWRVDICGAAPRIGANNARRAKRGSEDRTWMDE